MDATYLLFSNVLTYLIRTSAWTYIEIDWSGPIPVIPIIQASFYDIQAFYKLEIYKDSAKHPFS